MSRFALLSCFLLLVSCGADSGAKKSTSQLAVPTDAPAGFATIGGGVSALAIYQTSTATPPTIVTLGTAVQGWSSEGEALPTSLSPTLSAPLFVDTQGDDLWFANHNQLQAMHLPTQELGEVITLPEGTQISAIEVGFRGTVFVADANAMRVHAVSAKTSAVLWEGTELGRPRSLLLNGGSLIVGTDAGVLSFNLKSGAHTLLSAAEEAVVSLAHDHLGYFVALTASGKILQVKSEGESRLLHTLAEPAAGMAFDTQTRRLYLADKGGIEVHDYLDLSEGDKELWAARDARLMKSYRKNGMTVAGGEYWPSHGTTNVSYPDDILWGFYPSPDEVHEGSAASAAPPAAAIACAEASYRQLQKFVDSNAANFHRAAERRGASKQFYLWVNDYSNAAKDFPHEQRESKFWYWQRKPAVTGRVPGFWKWETTLMQDGSCHWPKIDQINSYLNEDPAGAK